MKSPKYKRLNLGCGTIFRNDWTNIDLISNSPDVIDHDLKSGIPFENCVFDAVYHSHVLEHMTPEEGVLFTRECARVLRPGGILRIAVPDLETIAKVYLEKLEKAVNGGPSAEEEYRWIVVEMLDQIVREKSGGRMAALLAEPSLLQLPFILTRIGDEGLYLREKLLHPTATRARPLRLFARLISTFRSGLLFARLRSKFLESCIGLFAGNRALENWSRGTFRASGEIHQWMYDRFSLKCLLETQGFEKVVVREAEESAIEGFSGSELEIVDGRSRKPDSIYIEGIRKPT